MSTTTERAAHTPGPWIVWEPEYDDVPAHGPCQHILVAKEREDDCHQEIARVWCRSSAFDGESNVPVASELTEASAPPTAIANARIIAAAPELAEALRGLTRSTSRLLAGNRAHVNLDKLAIEAARAALRKAGLEE